MMPPSRRLTILPSGHTVTRKAHLYVTGRSGGRCGRSARKFRDDFVTSACAVCLGDSQQNVLDISGLTGSHYLFFGAGRGNGEEVNVMKVYKLTLKE